MNVLDLKLLLELTKVLYSSRENINQVKIQVVLRTAMKKNPLIKIKFNSCDKAGVLISPNIILKGKAICINA